MDFTDVNYTSSVYKLNLYTNKLNETKYPQWMVFTGVIIYFVKNISLNWNYLWNIISTA